MVAINTLKAAAAAMAGDFRGVSGKMLLYKFDRSFTVILSREYGGRCDLLSPHTGPYRSPSVRKLKATEARPPRNIER